MQIWYCFSLWSLPTSPRSFKCRWYLGRCAHSMHDVYKSVVYKVWLFIVFTLTCCCCQFCHCTCWAHPTCDSISTAWEVLLILFTVTLSLRLERCSEHWICWCRPSCRIGLEVGGSIRGVHSVFAHPTSCDVVLEKTVEAAILKKIYMYLQVKLIHKRYTSRV